MMSLEASGYALSSSLVSFISCMSLNTLSLGSFGKENGDLCVTQMNACDTNEGFIKRLFDGITIYKSHDVSLWRATRGVDWDRFKQSVNDKDDPSPSVQNSKAKREEMRRVTAQLRS